MVEILVTKVGEWVVLTINGQQHPVRIYRRDTLLPDGQVDVLGLIHDAISKDIAPVQVGAFHRAPCRMRSYKRASVRRAELGLSF